MSMISESPKNAEGRFSSRMDVGGIPTPLASDMSRAKFDFSGYDPSQRKKKKLSPERKVIKKVEEDMEIFFSDNTHNPDATNLDKINLENS